MSVQWLRRGLLCARRPSCTGSGCGCHVWHLERCLARGRVRVCTYDPCHRALFCSVPQPDANPFARRRAALIVVAPRGSSSGGPEGTALPSTQAENALFERDFDGSSGRVADTKRRVREAD